MFLVENVILSIVPVREARMVARCLLDRPRWLLDLVNLACSSLTFLTPELGLVRRGQVHVVWIDNSGLFLQIEGILMILNIGLGELAIVVLFVVGIELLGVGISDESIDTASLTSALISCRQCRN